MPEGSWSHRREPARDEGAPEDGYGAEEQLRRALDQERHRLAARRVFDAAPLYRVRFEENGTVSLSKKAFDYWPARPPSAAIRWRVLSTHRDLEDAERRLRLITSPPVHYHERGRLAQAPPAD